MPREARRLTQADQPAWRNLRIEALERFPSAFLTGVEEQQQRSAAKDRAGLATGNWWGLFDTEMIGQAALIPMPQIACTHRMEIGAFYLTPGFQGTGAAEYLMQTMEDAARARDALQLELSVAASNPKAIRFYEKLGFRRYGIQPRAVILNGQPQDDLFYVKMLDG